MPRARRLMAATAIVLSAAGLAAPVAASGQEPGTEQPWPVPRLSPQTTVSSPPVAPQPADSSASTESENDGVLPLVLTLAVATVALVAIESFFAVRRARRTRAAAQPLTPPGTAPTPGARYAAPELARLAADYLEIVSSGSRRPVVDLAARRSWDVERTRRALGRARARGLLVSEGRGRVGGTLSDEARRLLDTSPDAVAQPRDRARRAGRHAGDRRRLRDHVGQNGHMGRR